MTTYEQKLTGFAQGKKLIRLSRPVRDRADAICDACGSTQPRTLYPLKELDTGRHYFVGDSCLKELMKLSAIPRRFGRESGQLAYETEMQLRAQETLDPKTNSVVNGTAAALNTPDSESLAGDALSASPTDGWHLFPAVLIIETPEHCQGFVSLTSVDGNAYGWGHANEPRYEETWRLAEEGFLLEKVKAERPDARILCLTQAWEQARSQLEGRDLVTPPPNGAGGDRHGPSPSPPLLALLQLMTPTPVVSDHSNALENGDYIARVIPNRL